MTKQQEARVTKLIKQLDEAMRPVAKEWRRLDKQLERYEASRGVEPKSLMSAYNKVDRVFDRVESAGHKWAMVRM